MRLGAWARAVAVSMMGFVCCSGLSQCGDSYPLPCQLTFELRDWAQVAETCRPVTWSGRARLAEAWIAYERPDTPQALAILAELVETDVSADAAYLTGTIRAREDEPSEQVGGRAQLEQALRVYRLAGRHVDVSRAAAALFYDLEGSSFDARLDMAKLAVAEAERSDDQRQQRLAHRALAEIYDLLGMAEAARDEFVRAQGASEDRPEDEAFTHFKYGIFVLDLGELHSALRAFDRAAEEAARAIRLGRGARVRRLVPAIHLNRADAYCQLGDPDAAKRELDRIEENDELRSKLRLVRGYVAASRNDRETAMRLFSEADDGTLDSDYQWRVSLELARLHHRAGHPDAADRAYHAAIDKAEDLRGTTEAIELRPWVLARRIQPYHERLSLLVERGRLVDALAVAESIHARSWLDAVLSRTPRGPANPKQALKNARTQRLPALTACRLTGPELMARVGTREALVFVATGSTTWRAHVVNGQVTFQQLPASAAAAIADYREHPGDHAVAERAAAVLIPKNLQHSEQPLYIVASGTLANQPLTDVLFAGLQRDGRYLIEDRPIAHLPGLAALRCAPGPWEEEHRIFIGDSHGDLPKAREEVMQQAAAMRATLSVGTEATRRAVQLAQRAGLLHMAVHGSSTQHGRAVVLADGDFPAADVLDLGLGPRLAILTGCATAISPDRESWAAFPSAFLAAGSRHVIATLRSVDDDKAAAFMRVFYAQPTGRSPIQQLAAAQRQLARERKLRVEDWASFGVWGAECPP